VKNLTLITHITLEEKIIDWWCEKHLIGVMPFVDGILMGKVCFHNDI